MSEKEQLNQRWKGQVADESGTETGSPQNLTGAGALQRPRLHPKRQQECFARMVAS